MIFTVIMIVTFFLGLPLLEKYIDNEHKFTLFGKVIVHILGFSTFLVFYTSLLGYKLTEKAYKMMFKKEYRRNNFREYRK